MVSLTEGTLLFQIINFFILVAILAKFAYKPLLKVLEERRNKIESDLDAAAQARSTPRPRPEKRRRSCRPNTKRSSAAPAPKPRLLSIKP